MKRKNLFLLIIILVSLNFSNFSFAQSPVTPSGKEKTLKWYSFEEAYNLNKKKPKKVFIDVYTVWCGWCKKMDSETFANPVIAAYMDEHFYCVKIDAERKDTVVIDGITFVNPNPGSTRSTHQLANELLRNQMTYPSYVFLNEKGQSLTVVPGYQTAKDFEGILAFFGEDAYLTTKWEDFRAGFQGKVK